MPALEDLEDIKDQQLRHIRELYAAQYQAFKDKCASLLSGVVNDMTHDQSSKIDINEEIETSYNSLFPKINIGEYQEAVYSHSTEVLSLTYAAQEASNGLHDVTQKRWYLSLIDIYVPTLLLVSSLITAYTVSKSILPM